jgi:hypothetical protein
MQQLFTFVPSHGTNTPVPESLQRVETAGDFVVSISKSYFRRQVPLLRRMVRLAQNPFVADRLSEMARDYEMKAGDGPEESQPAQIAKDDNDHGQTN